MTRTARGGSRTALVCIYSSNSNVEHIVEQLSPSVSQLHLWALDAPLPAVAKWTRGTERAPKFHILNRLLDSVGDADRVLFSDDDIGYPRELVPRLVDAMSSNDLAAAQPSLTLDSFHVLRPSLQRPGLVARELTWIDHMVFCLDRSFLKAMARFDEDLDWGAGVLWAQTARRNGLRCGVIDACAVEHKLRPMFSAYGDGPPDANGWRRAFAVGCRALEKRGVAWPEMATLSVSHEDRTRSPEPVCETAEALLRLAMRHAIWNEVVALIEHDGYRFDASKPMDFFVRLSAALARNPLPLQTDVESFALVLDCALAIAAWAAQWEDTSRLTERIRSLRGDERTRFALEVYSASAFTVLSPHAYVLKARAWQRAR